MIETSYDISTSELVITTVSPSTSSQSSIIDVCNITVCFECIDCDSEDDIVYQIYFTIKVSVSEESSIDTDTIEQSYKDRYSLSEDDDVEIIIQQDGREFIATVTTNSTDQDKLYQIGNDVVNDPLTFAREYQLSI